MTSDTDTSRWRLSGEGMLIWRDTGHKAFRIDHEGTMWIWDKKVKRERPLVLEDLVQFVYEQSHG